MSATARRHAFNTAFRSHRRRLHELLAQWIADTHDELHLPEI
jgi:hypothetical protein